MSREELDELVQLAEASKSSAAVRDLLRFLRKEKLRSPELVMKHGYPLLQSRGGLDDELWTIHEQVLAAALDVGDLDTADSCLTALKRKFPRSARVKRLEGMILESVGNYAGAEGFYKQILTENPANIAVVKRQIASLLAQDDTAAAVEALNKFLTVHCGDADGWRQLAAVHMSLGNFEEAAFCYEELVLLAPADPHYHCRLAELYYTMGGSEGLRKARKHFSQSLELTKNNARALHGLCVTCAAMAADKGCAKVLKAEQSGEVNAALHKWAVDELARLYHKSNKEMQTAAGVATGEQSEVVRSAVTSS
jgi:ER membrane protein complex subunit 2